MKSRDPVRFFICALAATILFCLISSAAFVSTMFIFEWIKTIPFNKFWIWIYMIASVLFAAASSILFGLWSYRRLKHLGNRHRHPTPHPSKHS